MSHLDANSVSKGLEKYNESPRIKGSPVSMPVYLQRTDVRRQCAPGGRWFKPEMVTDTPAVDLESIVQAAVEKRLASFLNEAPETLTVERVPAGTLPAPAVAKFQPREPGKPASGRRLFILNRAGVSIPTGCTDGAAQALIDQHGYENLTAGF